MIGPQASAKVTVIIPARNEEQDLEAALLSVLGQTGVDIEVIVVNDHSIDRTGPIADALARCDERLKVIHDPALPAGWLGKCNAMQQATAMATGDFLLFTDADIHHAPTALASGLAEMEQGGLDLVSYLPRIRCVSLWENVVMPVYIGGLAQYVTAGLTRRDSPDALAAGAFILIRSHVLRAVGGFEPIKHEMLDDVELARLVKKHGYRISLRAAPELVEVRFFKNNRHAFWGNTKNVLAALEGRLWLAPPVMMLPAFIFWTPIAGAVVAVWQRNLLLLLLAATAYAIQYGMLWLGRRMFQFDPVKALLIPLVPIPMFCCFAAALYYAIGHGAVRWRGRVIPVGGNPPNRAAT